MLPNIRDFYVSGGIEVPSDIESESLVETIVDSEVEREEPAEAAEGPFEFEVVRERERLSSSSTVERIRLVERREVPPELRPQVIFPPLPDWTLRELEVQIEDGLARIHPQTRLVVSWDFHQVLDCFRWSARQMSIARTVDCLKGFSRRWPGLRHCPVIRPSSWLPIATTTIQ